MADTATALYRLYGSDDRLLYIGITADPERRWQYHASQQPWWPEVARKSVAWLDSWQKACQAESEAIRAERPPYNKHVPRQRGEFGPNDRHRTPGLSWHPPDDLAAWAKAEAARQGVRLSSLLTEALAEKRQRVERRQRQRQDPSSEENGQ